ncbi:MAG: hypothetical protein DRQ35_03410 [Gammaproteobacteria bacterium]|nr:MAG: hypothetical protein DRQ35_03410 [Gammaproteobacteria bacterium]
MAFTQVDLDNLNSAIASGKRRVRLGQREVEYHSIEQMLKAKDAIQEELNRSTSTIPRPRSYLSRTGKGL